MYPQLRYFRGENSGNDTLSLLKQASTAASNQQRVVFLGEFGVPTRPNISATDEHKMFSEMMESVINSGIPLAAIWDYDPDPTFDKAWNIATPERLYQLDAVEAANRRFVR
jgi:hypothetical protein